MIAPDQKARHRAVDPERSCAIVAPAGSGKTSLLVLRMLKLLARVDAPEAVLAITFTRKAAGEMRKRVAEALREPNRAPKNAYEAELLEAAKAAAQRHPQLAEQPSRLSMLTFDALAYSILQRAPLAVGALAGLVPTENPEALYRQAAWRAMNALEGSAHWRQALAVADGDVDWLAGQIGAWLGRRDQVELLFAEGMPDAPEEAAQALLAKSEALVQAWAEELLKRLSKAEVVALIRRAAAARIADAYAKGEPIDERWKRLSEDGWLEKRDWEAFRAGVDLLFTKSGSLRKRWNGFSFPSNDEKKEAEALMEEVRESELAELLSQARVLPQTLGYSDEERAAFLAVMHLFFEARRQLAHLFARSGKVDFVEIGLGAIRALGSVEEGASDLLLGLDARLAHVLVDEFQDTSRWQVALLARLVAGFDGRERTLFVVGDPMQSIYRFRKADVEIFLALLDAAKRRQPCFGLPAMDCIELFANFRSAASLVHQFNRMLPRLVPQKDLAIDAEAADARKKGEIRLVLGKGSDKAAEVEQAFAEILRLRKALGDEARLAALAPTRSWLAPLAARLQKEGIRFRAVDLQSMADTRAIRWLRALVALSIDPANAAAWASLLRAPMVGLDAQALARLQAAIDGDWRPQAIRQASKALSDARWRMPIARLVEAIEAMFAELVHRPLAAAVERALIRLGVFSALDEKERRTLSSACDLLSEMEASGEVSLAVLDEALAKLYAAPDASPEAEKLVLSTMHAAKGLEWDGVVLFGLGERPWPDTDRFVWTSLVRADDEYPLLGIASFRRGKASMLEFVRALEQKAQEAERKRLFYVGCTRAHTHLVLIGSLTSTGASPKGSMLSFLGDRQQAIEDALQLKAEGFEVVQPPKKVIGLCLSRWQEETADVPSDARPLAPPLYAWAGIAQPAIGEAVHRLLMEVGRIGIEHWEAMGKDPSPLLRRVLRQAGLAPDRLDEALQTALAAWQRMRQSEKGRWLLSNEDKEDARCEWELVGNIDGRIIRRRIDRSFVVGDVRWVVDYKTASHTGGALASFLEQEKERYAPQLREYARIVAQVDPERMVKTALYFPLLDAFCEVEPV